MVEETVVLDFIRVKVVKLILLAETKNRSFSFLRTAEEVANAITIVKTKKQIISTRIFTVMCFELRVVTSADVY